MISVCMATYNGENFILEQINSIIPQLSKDDELIISDDMSNDNTLKIINNLNDRRIKVIQNKFKKGVNRNFENAFLHCSGEYIFMSDQDDVWIEGRLEKMIDILQTGKMLVSSNIICFGSNICNENYVELELHVENSDSHVKNILNIFSGRIGYYGCAMAFNRKLLKLILPIPSFVESHDLWIAMAANIIKSNAHIHDATLKRRIHGNNLSVVKRFFLRKAYSRIIFLISFLILTYRSKIFYK